MGEEAFYSSLFFREPDFLRADGGRDQVYVQALDVAAVDYGGAAVRQEGAQRLLGYHVLKLRVDARALCAVDDGARSLRQMLYLKHARRAPARLAVGGMKEHVGEVVRVCVIRVPAKLRQPSA